VIRRDLRETGWGGEWIQLAQDRSQRQALVNTVIKLFSPGKVSLLPLIIKYTATT
jgi:hypothetical protein